jgi:hypothetical protein
VTRNAQRSSRNSPNKMLSALGSQNWPAFAHVGATGATAPPTGRTAPGSAGGARGGVCRQPGVRDLPHCGPEGTVTPTLIRFAWRRWVISQKRTYGAFGHTSASRCDTGMGLTHRLAFYTGAEMIDEIALRFGPIPGAPPLRFCPGTVTVVVGPNNSGKSLLIRELDSFQQHQGPSPAIVEEVIVRSLSPSGAKWIEQ